MSCSWGRAAEILAALDEVEDVAARASAQTQRRGERSGELCRCKCSGARAGGDDPAGTHQQGMGETREDFLDVVRDEDEGGSVFLAREPIEKT